MSDGDLPFTCTCIAGIYLILMSLGYMGGSVLCEPIQTLQGFSCSEFVTRKVFSHSSPCLFTSQKSGIDLLHVEHMWNPTAPSVQTAELPTKQPQTWWTVRIKRNIVADISQVLDARWVLYRSEALSASSNMAGVGAAGWFPNSGLCLINVKRADEDT